MNKLRYLAAALLLSGMLFFIWSQVTNAQSFHTGTNVTIGQKDVLDKTVFAAGQTVDINTEVDGDVFCVGQTITISGTVHGDVICAGQTVTVSGKVDGDIRLAGQTVTVSAIVSGNATIGAQTFVLDSSGAIDGDMTVGTTTATINGKLGRDLTIGSGTATLASSVGRNVTGDVTDLVLTSTANVAGNIEYTSKNTLQQNSNAIVGGTVTQKEPTQVPHSKRGAIFGFGFGWFVYVLLAMAFTALVIAILFPQLLREVSERAVTNPWKALATGLLSSFAAPVVISVIGITVIGIPLAIIASLAWLLVLLVSGVFFAFYLGRLVMQDTRHAVLITLVGTMILSVVYFVPILGFVIFLAAVWMGSGMVLMELFRRTPKPIYHPVAITKTSKK